MIKPHIAIRSSLKVPTDNSGTRAALIEHNYSGYILFKFR